MSSVSLSTTPLQTLLLANTLSWLGTSIRLIALPWLVLQSTGNATQTGLVAIASQVGHLTSLALTTRSVDRMGYRRVSLITDYASAITIAALPLLALTTQLTLPILLSLAFVQALFDAPGATARASIIPELVKETRVTLARANAWGELLESSVTWAGPVLAGLLITAIGAINVLWLDVLSFLLSAVLIAVFVPQHIDDKRTHLLQEGHASVGRWVGWQFLVQDIPLRNVFLSSVVFSACMAALFGVLFPLVARASGDVVTLGLLIGAFGGGAVVGTVAYGRWGAEWSVRRTFIVGVVGLSLMFVALPFQLPVWLLACICLLAGVLAGPNGPVIATLQHERAPEAIRAQVLGAASMSTLLASPLGLFLIGIGVDQQGWVPTTALVAAVFVVVVMIVASEPQWKSLDSYSTVQLPLLGRQEAQDDACHAPD